MASLNRVVVMGNLGADPELRYTQSQTPVCTLSIATTDYRKGPDGQSQEQTEWHRVVVWSRQAENCAKYLAKGRSVLVEGKLQTRSWEDKQGQKRYMTEIVAQNVQFIGGRSDRAGASNHQGSSYDNGPQHGGGQQQGNFGGGQDMGGSQNMGAPETPGLDDIPF